MGSPSHPTVTWLRLLVASALALTAVVAVGAPPAAASHDPVFTVDDVTMEEGDGPLPTAFSFTVTSDPATPVDESVTVDYETVDFTAKAGSDYTATSGTLTFDLARGASEQTVTVQVTGDSVLEDNEVFFLGISNPSQGTIGDGQGDGTILNDDGPTISVDDIEVTEGDSGTTPATFTVQLSGANTVETTVDYTTADDTAEADSDYSPTSGTLTFAPGQTARTVTVDVLGDEIDEAAEDFELQLSNATGGSTISDDTAVGTILNDDAAVILEVSDAAVVEGDPGLAAAPVLEFVVTATGTTEQDVSFAYETVDGTATAGSGDYQSTGTLLQERSIEPGTPEIVQVTVNPDTTEEPFETLFLELTEATNASIARRTGEGVIQNDDATVSVADASFAEDVGDGPFTLTLSQPFWTDVEIGFLAEDDDRDNEVPEAREGQDYTNPTGADAQVTIPAGSTSAVATVPIADDALYEHDETFVFVVDSASDGVAGAGAEAYGVIEDDDPAPGIRILDATYAETDAGGTSRAVTVQLVDGTGSPTTAGRAVSADYATSDGVSDSASDAAAATTGDGDYTARTGTITVGAGSQTAAINIQVNGDTSPEADEHFFVTLSAPDGGSIIDPKARVTITNDDANVAVEDAVAAEADAGTTTVDVIVRRGLVNGQGPEVTFDWTTRDASTGTQATADVDYVADSGTDVVIPADQETVALTITINGDVPDEDDEVFEVAISNVRGAVAVDSEATVTIVDDPASLTVGDASVEEGDTGTTTLSFPVELDVPSSEDVTFDYVTADQTATASTPLPPSTGDYEPEDDSATIPAGATSILIDVTVNGDTEPEDDETLTFTISNVQDGGVGVTVADDQGIGTILNDDVLPTLSVTDTTVVEGDEGTTDVEVTIELSESAGNDVTVDYATADDSAEAGSDYQETSGTATIAAGETSTTVTVVVAGDTAPEGDETFEVRLSNPENATIGDGTGVVTISDDDALPNEPPTVTAPDRTADTFASLVYEADATDPDGDDLTIRWDFGDGSDGVAGNPVNHTYTAPGTYTATVSVSDGNGGGDSDTFEVVVADHGEVTRNAGPGRIETAVAVSRAHWPGTKRAAASTAPATDAILARADLYPDALAAAPLAASLDAPLLLTPSDSLVPVVEEELDRLGVETVWLMGGTAAISQGVEDRLVELGYEIERLSGPNRFATAREVARQVGASVTGEVVLALGAHPDPDRAWPDALSAGALSASPDRLPVLLSTPDTLPDSTVQSLDELDAERVVILGGTAAISDDVEQELQRLGYATSRLAGSGRYVTSVRVAEDGLDRHGDGRVPVVFATGSNFPDGLAAGALAARLGGIVVLVPTDDTTGVPEIGQFLRAHGHRFDHGVVVGGGAAVSETVRQQVEQAMTVD